MQPAYDSWSLSSFAIPPRSKLYPLVPIGVGTAFVESLSGYVARLAEAHSISVGDLVGHVLSELADPQDPMVTAAAKAVRAGGHGFRACSYAINGVTDRATKWVHVLETATRRRDLRFLTLLPFRNAIPENLFHRHRAWCSFCFEQWRMNGQTVYEPLLWAFKVSSHCRVHQQPLSHSCHRCKRQLSPLGVFSRPGYCERCGCWLGASYVDEDRSKFISTDGEDQTWSSRQVEGLLAMLPRVDPTAVRESLRGSLIAYLGHISNGNVLALAEYIHCPRSILQNWLDGATVPRLENLLRTARSLNVPASSLFAPSGPTPTNFAAAKDALVSTRNRSVSPSRPAIQIRQALLTALHEIVPLSLSEVARRLGYKSTERLYQADRALCHKIAARHRQSGHSHWWKKPGATRICEVARLKEILEESLKLIEPTSVRQIAANLGYSNAGYFYLKFPELCAAIREKLSHAEQARHKRMRRALKEALREDPAPTLVDLSRRLGYSSSAVLRAHEPHLCDQLAARHRAHLTRCRADLEAKAKAALGEIPVPTVRDVCKRLAITLWFMNKYFPAVRRMIAMQHRRCVAAETEHRHQLLFHEIRTIAVELQSQGLYPSVTKIVERIPERSRSDWTVVTLALREARKALCISK
jgi:AraC-like DNA-binding protein